MRFYFNVVLTLSVMVIVSFAVAQIPGATFWRHRVRLLVFTTTPQSMLASLCSGIATIETRNASNQADNVLSNLTINLSTSANLTYFSDSNCTVPITNLTVATGTSLVSFYFINSSAATVPITASATGYVTVMQSETFNANNFVWTGAGGNASWSTGGNWSGGSAPGAGNVAVFDSSCVSNCSPSINSNISIGGFRSHTGYAGTVTQANGFTVSVGTTGWVQTSGAFVGSTAGDAMTITTNYVLVGGTFQSTTGTFSMLHGGGAYGIIFYKVGASSTFTAGTAGTVSFDSGCATTDLTLGPANYKNVSITNSAGCGTVIVRDTTATINGNLTIDHPAYSGTFNGGTLLVGGNVTTTGPDNWYGTATIKLTGNASGQTITSVSGGTLPNLEIAAGANAVTIAGSLFVLNSYSLTSSGTFTSTGSTLTFSGGCGTSSVIPGTVTYNNITFAAQCHAFNMGGGTMTVAGNLSFTNPGYNGSVNSGTINVSGNVTTTGPSIWSGSAVVRLVGNGSGQSVVSSSAGYIPNLTLATGANAVTISGALNIGNLIKTSVGTFTATGSTLGVRGPTVTVGSENYNNVTFGGGCTTITLTGTMNILGTMTLTDYCSGALNSGTVAVGGNLVANAWGGGSASITMNGATQQTITQVPGAIFPNGTTTLNNVAGLLLASNLILNSGQTLSSSGGSISMAGYNLTLSGLALGGNSVTRSSGVLTVGGSVVPAGTQSLYGGTINP